METRSMRCKNGHKKSYIHPRWTHEHRSDIVFTSNLSNVLGENQMGVSVRQTNIGKFLVSFVLFLAKTTMKVDSKSVSTNKIVMT